MSWSQFHADNKSGTGRHTPTCTCGGVAVLRSEETDFSTVQNRFSGFATASWYATTVVQVL